MKKIPQSFSLLTIIVALAWPNLAQAAAAQDPAAVDVINKQKPLADSHQKPKLMVLQARVDVDKSQHIDPAALTNLVSKIAAEQGTFQVLSNADVAAMLDNEGQKQLMGCTETSCMAEIGQAMGAQFLLYAQVGQIGETYLTTVNMLDVEKAQVSARESLPVKRSENLIQATEVATQRVFGQELAFVEPKAEPVATAKTNYLQPAKWGLLGAAGLVAVGGLGATGFAFATVGSINDQVSTEKLEGLHFQAAVGDTVAVSAYSFAGLLAVASAVVFGLDAFLPKDDNES